MSSIGTGVDIQSTETATNRTVKDDSCNIPVGQADINPSNIDFVTESCEGNIVSTVLNKTLDIIDSVVAVVDDIEKSRKEPYLCSTRQLENISHVIYDPDWSLFSSSKSLGEVTADFSGFDKEVTKSTTPGNDVGEMLE